MQVIKLQGPLDRENSRKLRDKFLDLYDEGEYQIQIDFENVDTIDSSGLGKLLLFHEKLNEKNGQMQLVNVKAPEVTQLFQLLKLEKVININYCS